MTSRGSLRRTLHSEQSVRGVPRQEQPGGDPHHACYELPVQCHSRVHLSIRSASGFLSARNAREAAPACGRDAEATRSRASACSRKACGLALSSVHHSLQTPFTVDHLDDVGTRESLLCNQPQTRAIRDGRNSCSQFSPYASL